MRPQRQIDTVAFLRSPPSVLPAAPSVPPFYLLPFGASLCAISSPRSCELITIDVRYPVFFGVGKR